MPAGVTLGDGDVDRAGLGWVGKEAVEIGGGVVAHLGGGPAGEHRGHLGGVLWDRRPDEIDAAVQGPELPSPRRQPIWRAVIPSATSWRA